MEFLPIYIAIFGALIFLFWLTCRPKKATAPGHPAFDPSLGGQMDARPAPHVPASKRVTISTAPAPASSRTVITSKPAPANTRTTTRQATTTHRRDDDDEPITWPMVSRMDDSPAPAPSPAPSARGHGGSYSSSDSGSSSSDSGSSSDSSSSCSSD